MRFSGARNIVCAVLLTLAGCSKAPEPAKELPPTTLPTASVPTDEPAADDELAAESGLAIKRGIVTLAADHTAFSPCGEEGNLWVIDQTGGLLARTFSGEKPADGAPLKLYIEAYGERATTAEDLPATATGFAGVFVLEEVLYALAGPEGQAHGCGDGPVADYIVAASGSEPFWSAEVTDAALAWHQSEEPKEISLPAPQTQDSEGAVSYRAAGDDHQIELMIEAQPCRNLSGAYFAYSARAKLDGKQFAGCARIGR